jgi:hypothetical protein
LILGGVDAFILVAILCILEVSVSFDNAVVNAKVLERMSQYWQKLFLTVGVLIAVFGMRLLFPLLLVGVTAQIGPIEVVRLALEGGSAVEPGTYAALLHEAHPSIASFGGMFLLMLFLDFVFEDRAVSWLSWLERPLARIGKLDQLSVVVALVALVVVAETLASDPGKVMIAGGLGVVTYLVVNGLGELFENEGSEKDGDSAGIHGDALVVEKSLAPPQRGPVVPAVGKAAFFLFLYLEVLDASFSFDGVVGAFAISQDIFIIAAGLGVGAMYIRSLTIYLVRKGTLDEYAYLEHGAHWAIGALAVILLISIKHEVPEVITGLVGIGFITAAVISSVIRNRKGGLAAAAEERRNVLINS